ncbi:MAG: hypothetical protein KF878_05790 [Planctomycetes bacterium]|nr:hypothetical protein [Planctomycetota bacterium]
MHLAHVRTGLVLLAIGVLHAGCGGSSSKGRTTAASPAAGTAPTLVGVEPGAGQRVGPTDPLVATFDVALLASTVAAAVAVSESAGASGTKVGHVSQSAAEVVVFGPDLPWALDASVTLQVATSLRAADGTPLAAAASVTRSAAPTTDRISTTHVGSNIGVVTLRDGRLLLCGGNVGAPTGAIDLTTIVDPSTGVATASGPLSQPRFGHVTVLLADGRVAVVGGQTTTTLHTTIEVWDPATGVWTVQAPAMALRTSMHAVLPLTGGRWLVVGGYANTAQSQPQTVVEVLAADMSAVTASAQATTLGGQAALLGASTVALFGRVTAGPTRDVEVLRLDAAQADPVTSVTRLSNVLVAPAGATADWNHPSVGPLADGRALVQQADATCVVTVSLQGAPTATGVAGPHLVGRGRTFTRLLPTQDGALLIGPGGRSPGASGTDPVADLFRPGAAGAAGTVVALTPRTGRRSAGVAALRDGRIMVVGGRDGGLSGPLLGGLDSIEVFTHEALAQSALGARRETIGIGLEPASGWSITTTDRTFTFVTSGALAPNTTTLSQALTVRVNGQPAASSASLAAPRRLVVTLAGSVTLAAGDWVEVSLGPGLRDVEGRTLDLTRGVTSGVWRVR